MLSRWFVLWILMSRLHDTNGLNSECQNTSNLTTINVYALSTIAYASDIIAAQTLAVNEVNCDNIILPNHYINFTVIECSDDSVSISLCMAQKMSEHFDEDTSNDIPIVLGAPWSSMSIKTSAILNAHKWGQLTASSTSIELSDNDNYPYFYRIIPSDLMQAQSIIDLCLYYDWTSISVLYFADAYGTYLSVEILNLASLNNINMNAIGYTNSIYSQKAAINELKEFGTFINMLIFYSEEINDIFQLLSDNDLYGYPYYYILTDSSMASNTIINTEAYKYVSGYIGTLPLVPTQLDETFFSSNQESMKVYTEAALQAEYLHNIWNDTYLNNPDIVYGLSVNDISAYSYYGWDSVMTLANMLNIYYQTNNDSSIPDISTLNGIISQVQFYGITGHVIFTKNGDRQEGLYGYGNILNNGKIKLVGYHQQHGSDTSNNTGMNDVTIDDNLMSWPNDFISKGIIPPKSEVIYKESELTIYKGLIIFVLVSSYTCISIGVLMIIFIMYNRKRTILKASSWRLNIVTSFGYILGMVSLIFNSINVTEYGGIMCDLQVITFVISCTLLFMPLYLKSWRVSEIFNDVLEVKTIKDKKLFAYLGIAILIDIIILVLFSVILNYHNIAYKVYTSNIVAIDELQYIKHTICMCQYNKNKYTFYIVILVYKTVQLIFGLYVILLISKISSDNKLMHLNRFDETNLQIKSVYATVFLVIVFGIVYILTNEEAINLKYIELSLALLLTYNIVYIFNIFPRCFAIIFNKEMHYLQSPEQKLKDLFFKKLRQYGIEKDLHRLSAHGPGASLSLERLNASLLLNTSDSTAGYTVFKPPTPSNSKNKSIELQ